MNSEEKSMPMRGKLFIFLGAVPGVGKSRAMVQSARETFGEDVGIVVGTDSNLEDILVRQPNSKVLLMPHLAHANAADSTRSKRYLDVEALLTAGIHVYTTLNVYEIESLRDLVQQVTGVSVVETVPDRFLESAAHIQVVDLPVEEIQTDAKYRHEAYLEQFYRPGNLLALREMCLRYAAQRLDSQMENYMRAKNIEGPWPVGGKVLVCVSSSPFSLHLIRDAYQMATSLKSEWLAVYVETTKRHPKGEHERTQIAQHLQLAEQLGAEVLSIPGSTVDEEILALARRRNVKHVIIGKPRRQGLGAWFHRSIVNNVIRSSGGIHVHVIPGTAETSHTVPLVPEFTRNIKWGPYAVVSIFVALLTLALRGMGPFFDLVNIALLYLFPVLFSAARWGLGPSLFAVGFGLLTFDFFFVPPFYSFAVSDLRYLISFAVFLTVATLTASLASRLRQQLRSAQQREIVTATLYSLSRQMTAVVDLRSVLNSIAHHVAQTVGYDVSIFLPNDTGELELAAHSGAQSNWIPAESDMAVTNWVYAHGDVAGRGTETLRENPNVYVPLRTEDQVHGVLVVKMETNSPTATTERLRIVQALSSLAAVAISRIKLEEEAKVAHLAAESERLRTALFDSISHELRTPLATILGSVTGLLEGQDVFSPENRRDLLLTIREGAMRMNRLITNLLEMVRLESGMIRLNRHWCDLEDIVGVALAQMGDSLQHREVKVYLDEAIPPLNVDEVLIEQALVNVLSNAVKYSQPPSGILLSAQLKNGMVCIMVADEGIGISEAESDRIFEKFYRSKLTRHIPGTGLGLAICKGIVEAHGGLIHAKPNVEQGTVITVCLPVSDAEPASTHRV